MDETVMLYVGSGERGAVGGAGSRSCMGQGRTGYGSGSVPILQGAGHAGTGVGSGQTRRGVYPRGLPTPTDYVKVKAPLRR